VIYGLLYQRHISFITKNSWILLFKKLMKMKMSKINSLIPFSRKCILSWAILNLKLLIERSKILNFWKQYWISMKHLKFSLIRQISTIIPWTENSYKKLVISEDISVSPRWSTKQIAGKNLIWITSFTKWNLMPTRKQWTPCLVSFTIFIQRWLISLRK